MYIHNTQIFRQICDSNKSVQFEREMGGGRQTGGRGGDTDADFIDIRP